MNLVPGLDQIRGHAAAHVAETDERDFASSLLHRPGLTAPSRRRGAFR
jgi:hypothetical protein